jgi:N-acyl-D-amino-acid deacylase
MRETMLAEQGDLRFEVPWTTLNEYLMHLERRGVSVNVASFVGATTVRIHELGHVDRCPTRQELGAMTELVDDAMLDGAMGVGSSLIYAPGSYAKTSELIALARAAAKHGGMYISHLRSEGLQLGPAVDEFIEIALGAAVRAEIYHLKALGPAATTAFETALSRLESARARGLAITADMYPYDASGTGLDAAMPPWVQEGGIAAWIERLRQPMVREQVLQEMRRADPGWENHLGLAGGAERVLLVKFRSQQLKEFTGLTLAEVAARREVSPEDAVIDLVIGDESRVEAIYFNQAEDVVLRAIRLPWVSFASDAAAVAPEGVFLRSHPHPRAYGTFARVLGRYVRETAQISLAEAIRRLTGLPAENLRLDRRGHLAPGYYADVVVFDPSTVADRATYSSPHEYAAGINHVLVNGVHTVSDGRHTGALAGVVVRGPGWRRAQTRPPSHPSRPS